MSKTTSISLGDHFENFIKQQLTSGPGGRAKSPIYGHLKIPHP